MSTLFIDTPNLVFESHETQIDTSLEMSDEEIKTLRELGKKYSEIASLPIQNKRKDMWKRLNDLQKVKPMIWMNEICWNEMDVNDELRLRTSSVVCQRIETELRRAIYQWEHMQGDMVVEPIFYSPYIIHNTGFGIRPIADVSTANGESQVASRHFHNQFVNDEDIEKIKVPVITQDSTRTKDFNQAYKMIFDGIIDVEKRGSAGFWFAPWDDIVFWMGADEVLMNLALRPEFMHKLIDKLVDSYLNGLNQFEEQNLLASNNCNVRIGSGAYGYTDQLPKEDKVKKFVNTKDLWGSATPQIFGSVSPAMHEEFGVDYEVKWLSRFGLSYYGCCEPLHNKLDILKKIQNLRKVSISPWADVDKAAQDIGSKYVISLKPHPATLALEYWDPELVRKEIETKLEATKNCNVEIVIKDLSTIRNQPQRLWEYSRIVSEIAERY